MPMKKINFVFQRNEKKYLLSPQQYRALQEELSQWVCPDQYGKTAICSQYYDTPDLDLIRASVLRPAFKEKLRLRSYGVPTEDTTVYLELKRKLSGVVYKRRAGLPLAEARQFLHSGQNPHPENRILEEIAYFLQQHTGIAPSYFIGCERLSYRGIGEEDLRITFDSELCYRTSSTDLSYGEGGRFLLRPGWVLMEIKVAGPYPLYLSELLARLKIYPVSFSKYGRAYLRELAESRQLELPLHPGELPLRQNSMIS